MSARWPRSGRHRLKCALMHGEWLRAPALVFIVVVSGCWPQLKAQEQVDSPAAPLRVQLVQGGNVQVPRIAVRSPVVALPSSRTPLQIRVTPADAIPRNSFLRLRGLPTTASLSEGYSIAPGSWAVPLRGLPDLVVNLPASVSGRSDLLISLVDGDGKLLAEARVALIIDPQGTSPSATSQDVPDTQALPPPAQARIPVLTPADQENAERLIARGERDLNQGNIAQARQFFQRAAQIGHARGALLLAATYDPRELARLNAASVQPNVAEARKWYMRAADLGATEAAQKLATLDGY